MGERGAAVVPRPLRDVALGGSLRGGVVAAGGVVLGALLAPQSTEEQMGVEACWAASDIDLFIYGLDQKQAEAKAQHIYDIYCANVPDSQRVLVVRSSKTVTLYSDYPTRRVQIVLKLNRSPLAVLLNFDLDICAVAWDGYRVYMLPRAARALESDVCAL